jgi:hypothetical protein
MKIFLKSSTKRISTTLPIILPWYFMFSNNNRLKHKLSFHKSF